MSGALVKINNRPACVRMILRILEWFSSTAVGAKSAGGGMTRILCCILWFGSLCFAQGARILIVTDLEGAGGVNDADEQLLPGQRRYIESRRILTGEVNAAVEGALAGGATEVVIWDGHDGSRTQSIDEIHPSAKLI